MIFIARMAAREMRASWRRLLFFFLCISIGVGAIVALRSVIQSVRGVFSGEARALIAADATISGNQAVSAELQAKIDQRLAEARATSVETVELATMVRPADRADRSRMVELRAIAPGFPYYGELKLADGVPFTQDLLKPFGVLVRPELLSQLNLEVGDGLMIGTHQFTIRGVIEAEPGRRLGAFSLGPRVFVDLDELRKTGLITFGTRANFQRLVKAPDDTLDALVSGLRADFRNSFLRVRSYKSTEEDIGENFGRAENYLSLVGLVIVILGGIGVSSVTRVFVQQKIRSIAILKCVGARASQLLAIYMAQVLALGVAGSVLGVVLAAIAVAAIPASLAAAATPGVTVDYGLTWPAVLQGAGIGLLAAILFSLVPLLDVRHVKPSILLRDESGSRRPDALQIAVMIGVGAGLVALAVWQAGSLRVGLIVTGGFLATAIALHLAGVALIKVISPLARSGWFPLRHAVLQLSRPGSQARIVLLAVGLGSFFIVGVRSLQESLVREFNVELSPEAPDMFLLDIQQDQVEALRGLLAGRQAQGAPEARLVPVLRARVSGVEGRELSLENYEDVRGRGSLAREYTITYRAALERNESVVAGQFWTSEPSSLQSPKPFRLRSPGNRASYGGQASPQALKPPGLQTPSSEGEVSVEEGLSQRFGIHVGDLMKFDVLGRPISAKVTSIRKVNWSDGRAGGFMFVFKPGQLEAAPHAYVSFLRGPADPPARGRLQADLVTQFPNVSVIDGREVMSSIKTVVDNVTLGVTVVGSLVVISGLMILIGAVAMTKFRRVYEAAIFKTLGATRKLISTILVLEYGVLGALAGTIGSIGAMALTWSVSRFAFDIPWRPMPGISLAGVLISAVLVAVVGVIASWEVLQRRPLLTLRGE